MAGNRAVCPVWAWRAALSLDAVSVESYYNYPGGGTINIFYSKVQDLEASLLLLLLIITHVCLIPGPT